MRVLRVFEKGKNLRLNTVGFEFRKIEVVMLLTDVLIKRNPLDPVMADVAALAKMNGTDGEYRQE